MKGVDAAGGPSDGKTTKGVTNYEQALNLAKLSSGTNFACTWNRSSKTFIEKHPSKRCGKWEKNRNCDFFMWADSCISRPSPEEIARMKKEEEKIKKEYEEQM